MNCDLIFRIYDSLSGTFKELSLKVPSDKELTLLDISIILKNKKLDEESDEIEDIKKIIEAINNSGFVGNNKIIQDNIFIKAGSSVISIQGNYTIKNLLDEYASYYREAFQYLNIPLNNNNIIVSSQISSIKFFTDGKKEVIILPNNEKAIKKYLDYLYIKTYAEKHNWTYDATYETIHRKTPISIGEFIRRYFFGKKTSRKLSKKFINLIDNMLLNIQFKNNEFSIDSEFNSLIDENRKIEIKDFINYYKKLHGISSSSNINISESIAKTLKDLNNRSENGVYFSIERITDKHIILNIINSPKYTSSETSIIPSEYYGDVTSVQEEYRGYTIVKFGDTYYASDSNILQYEDSLKSIKLHSTNLSKLKEIIDNNYNNPGSKFYSTISDYLQRSPNRGEDEIIITISEEKYNSIIKESAYKVYDYPAQFTRINMSYIDLINHLRQNYGHLFPDLEIVLNSFSAAKAFYSYVTNTRDGRHSEEEIKEYYDSIRNSNFYLYSYDSAIETGTTKNGSKQYKVKFKKLVNSTISVVPKYRHFKSDLIFIKKQLSELFGVNIHLLTTDDIKSNPTLSSIIGPNINYKKAFIYNNEVYVNIDIAHTSDIIHEYAHMMMAIIKTNEESSDLYYKLVDSVLNLPDYNKRIAQFRKHGDNRSEIDLREEILVTMLGYYCEGKINNWFDGNQKDLKELKQLFEDAAGKVFLGEKGLENITILSVSDALKYLGSYLLKEENFKKGAFIQTSEPRKITNLIAKLIETGKIEESCKEI